MGTQGEFKEFVNTGSQATWATGSQKYPFTYAYDTLHSLTNPPDVTALYAGSTNTDYVPAGSGSWGSLFLVTATTFTVLSGSMSNATGISIPASTTLKGQFTKMRFSAGSVIAYVGGL